MLCVSFILNFFCARSCVSLFKDLSKRKNLLFVSFDEKESKMKKLKKKRNRFQERKNLFKNSWNARACPYVVYSLTLRFNYTCL